MIDRLTEFSIIEQYFKKRAKNSCHVRLGIGDDCAILKPPKNYDLAISTDTLVGDVHFFINSNPEKIGHKVLAVNLSDLAAMGATPAWVMLSLTMPKANKKWLAAFSKGFFNLTNRFNVSLMGGDLTRGPLSITIQIIGFLPKGKALKRSGAKPGDYIYVSGPLGDAGAALNLPNQSRLLKKMETPEPKINLGKKLLTMANSCIDISDGFIADLKHILKASGVGAKVNVDKLPLSRALINAVGYKKAIQYALSSGDDYELCFTTSKSKHQKYQHYLKKWSCICVGKIERQLGLKFISSSVCLGKKIKNGFSHF